MSATNNSWISKIGQELKQLHADLDHFQVQLALGKAEAADRLEEIKRDASDFVHEVENQINIIETETKRDYAEVRKALDELRVQIALGKAEAGDAVGQQKKQILNGLSRLEKEIENSGILEHIEKPIDALLEKAKIKSEMLRVQMELGKYELRDGWEERKKQLEKKWNELSDKAEKFGEENLSGIKNELKSAYKDIRQYFLGN